jgi:hypothetical protein
MAYSTRRKSVNLSLLGIHVPRPSQRSPPTSTTATTVTSTTPTDHDQSSPPAKKLKRSHSDATAPDSIPQIQNPALLNSKDVPLPLATHTPPPSPPPSDHADIQYPKVDTEGLNDDVVVATIEQLEKTNNRPHLLKELAIAIAGHVHVVEM